MNCFLFFTLISGLMKTTWSSHQTWRRSSWLSRSRWMTLAQQASASASRGTGQRRTTLIWASSSSPLLMEGLLARQVIPHYSTVVKTAQACLTFCPRWCMHRMAVCALTTSWLLSMANRWMGWPIRTPWKRCASQCRLKATSEGWFSWLLPDWCPKITR